MLSKSCAINALRIFNSPFLIFNFLKENHGNNDNNTAIAACYRPHFTEGGCYPQQTRNSIDFIGLDGLHRQSIFQFGY
jgi:hypothetical protein